VVADSQFSGVRDPATRFLYVPYRQGISDFVRQRRFSRAHGSTNRA